jgi:hypothetical protein
LDFDLLVGGDLLEALLPAFALLFGFFFFLPEEKEI